MITGLALSHNINIHRVHNDWWIIELPHGGSKDVKDFVFVSRCRGEKFQIWYAIENLEEIQLIPVSSNNNLRIIMSAKEGVKSEDEVVNQGFLLPGLGRVVEDTEDDLFY